MASTAANPPPLAQPAICRHAPEVGAVCGKSARTDLCGGREVTRVPTATRRVGKRGAVPALVGDAPFPLPAHQTGRADFRHPAFRLDSSHGTQQWAKMHAAEAQHAERPEDMV